MLQKYFRFFSFHKRIFLLTVLAVGFFCLLTYFSDVGFTQNTAEFDALQKDVWQSSNAQANETPHTLVGSFYTVQYGIEAKLLLNNKGIAPLEVRPTLYNLSGQPLELPPVWIEARSFRFINLADWAGVGGESFRSGSIKLFHTGKDLILGAQIYLTDEAHSLSFEEKLAELGKFDSRRQEAVWFQPTNQTESVVVLSNTSNAPLTVTARLSKRPQQTGNVNVFQLAAHETKVLSLRQDFSDGQQFANADVVGLSLEQTSAKDALLARVGIADAGRGYSNLTQFSNPTTAKSNEYQGVGFQIDKIADEQLTPVIVAKNVGTQTTIITARVPYTRTNGTIGTINLPQTSLQAGEMRTLNVQQIIQRANQEQIKIASLEIIYNTAPGSIIVNAHSQSTNDNQVFRVPMWDPMNQRSPTGGYPWRIENTSTTKTYIKNITDREQYYTAHLNWENGNENYMLGMKRIAPNQTIEIDIKQLRDNQMPDEAGRIIPLNATKGQLKWSMKQFADVPPEEDVRQQLALIGRTEQIDTVRGISSNYACQNCCGDSYYSSYVTPIIAEVDVDQQVDFDVYQTDEDCYGELTTYERTFFNGSTSWSSSNTGVATVNNSVATGVSDGNVTITASWTDYFRETGEPCPPLTPLTQAGEQCTTDKEQTPTEQAKDDNQAPLAPGCGGCRSYRIYPRPFAYLIVRPPQVTIDPLDSVEVNGTRTVNIHVRKNGRNNILVVSMAVPQGQPQRATFDDGTTSKNINGGNGDFSYTIKGAMASEQIDDFNIRVFPQRSQGGAVYAVERFTVTNVMFSQVANCSGFDDVENPPYLFVPQNENNTVKAKIIPNGASGNFNLQAQQGITVSPTMLTSGEQTLTITSSGSTGTFTLQALANQSMQAAATLNISVLKRRNKTVVIHAITEDNDDVQVIPVGTTGNPNDACVRAGSNEFRDTIASGDDQILTDAVTSLEYISNGANGVCNTTANNTDISPSSANIPSASALQTALNDTYWGKQANVFFTATRATDMQINFDVNRDGLLDSVNPANEFGIIGSAFGSEDANVIDLYYLGTSLTRNSSGDQPLALTFVPTLESFFGPGVSASLYITAHEIGHSLEKNGSESDNNQDLMFGTYLPTNPCRIRKRNWDLINTANP